MTRYALIWPLCVFSLTACHAAGAPAAIDLSSTSSAAQIKLAQVQRVGAAEHASDGMAQQRYAFQPAAQPQITITPADG